MTLSPKTRLGIFVAVMTASSGVLIAASECVPEVATPSAPRMGSLASCSNVCQAQFNGCTQQTLTPAGYTACKTVLGTCLGTCPAAPPAPPPLEAGTGGVTYPQPTTATCQELYQACVGVNPQGPLAACVTSRTTCLASLPTNYPAPTPQLGYPACVLQCGNQYGACVGGLNGGASCQAQYNACLVYAGTGPIASCQAALASCVGPGNGAGVSACLVAQGTCLGTCPPGPAVGDY